MTTTTMSPSTERMLAKLKTFFGLPEVLKSESKEIYENMLEEFVGWLGPQDMMELLLLQQMMDSTWEYIRYTRNLSRAIDRRGDALLEAEVKRVKAEQEKVKARERAGQAAKPVNELERKFELEGAVDSAYDDISRIFDQATIERAHHRAVEASIDICERLNKQRSVALANRDNALELLGWYRDGFDRILRQASDQIIEVECNEQKSLIPSHDVPIAPTSEVNGISPVAQAASETPAEQTRPLEPPLDDAAPETPSVETQSPQVDPPAEPTS